MTMKDEHPSAAAGVSALGSVQRRSLGGVALASGLRGNNNKPVPRKPGAMHESEAGTRVLQPTQRSARMLLQSRRSLSGYLDLRPTPFVRLYFEIAPMLIEL